MASSTNKEGEPPQIVSFVKGAGHTLVMHRLRRMFDMMPNDPLLELAPATSNLLATSADLVLRFNRLLRYPFILVRLCKRWFPFSYLDAIVKFLHADLDTLDVGVSMQLHKIASTFQNESRALAWMASDAVQEFLEKIAINLLCHSLDAERKAAQVKHWESTKVTHTHCNGFAS